jgi:DNA repair protein RadC
LTKSWRGKPQAIVDLAKALGIAEHDDIIVGKVGHASLKGLKLI